MWRRFLIGLLVLLVVAVPQLSLPHGAAGQDVASPAPEATDSAVSAAADDPTATEQAAPVATEAPVPPTAPAEPAQTPPPVEAETPAETPVPTETAAPTDPAEPIAAVTPSATAVHREPLGFAAAAIADLTLTAALSPASPVLAGTQVRAQAGWPFGQFPGGSVTYTVFRSGNCSGTVFANAGTRIILFNMVGASDNVAFAAAGTYSWRVSYSGDIIHNPTSVCVPLTVKTIPALTLASSPGSLRAGEVASGVATLTNATSTAGGSVTYTVYSNNTCTTAVTPAKTSTEAVSNGVVPNSDPFVFVQAGTFYWRASYTGDANNNWATSSCVALIVSKAIPTLDLTLTPSPVVINGTARGVATLAGATGAAGGSVTYTAYRNSACSIQFNPVKQSTKTVVNGVVPNSDAFSFSQAGASYWLASYGGDANNTTATSSCVALTVQANPTLALTVTPHPVKAGVPASAAATLANATNEAGGTVTYTVYTDSGCTMPISPARQTTGTVLNGLVPEADAVIFPQSGTVYWAAAYSGDANNTAVTSSCLAVTVSKATSTLTAFATPDPVVVGDVVTLHSTLSADAVNPTGTVTYRAYLDSACTQIVPSGDPIVVTMNGGLIPASEPVLYDVIVTLYAQATYSGDANNAPASTPCTAVVVAKDLPLDLVLTPVSPVLAGERVSAQAIWSLPETPTGSITYAAFASGDCSGTPMAEPETTSIAANSVAASSSVTFPTGGAYSWQASFSGDGVYHPEIVCTPLAVKAKPTLTLLQLPNPVNIGEEFTAHMYLSDDAIDPTGTVTLNGYLDPGCTVPLSADPALSAYTTPLVDGVIPDPAPSIFSYPMTIYGQAAYSGDDNNAPATTLCQPATVAKGLPLTLILSPAGPIVAGDSVSAAATWQGGETPTGSVTYTAFNSADCSGTPFAEPETKPIVDNGVAASGTVTFPIGGTYSWQAAYSGDSIYNPETACEQLTVKATPSLSLYSTPDPITIGNLVTMHATLSDDAINPTGTATYAGYSDSACTQVIGSVPPRTVTLSGGLIPASNPVPYTFAGIVYGQVTYSGDDQNAPTSSACVAAEINTGPLTASIADVSLNPVDYSNAVQTISGEMVLVVRDPRATAEGWSVTISATSFAYAGTSPKGAAIPSNRLAVTAATPPDVLTGQPIGGGGPYSDSAAVGTLDQPRRVLSADPGYGSGNYTQTLPVTLEIPAGSQAGTYTAIVTVATTAAP